MATAEGLNDTIDRVIALFNARGMDLPDGFFDHRTQFLLNGAAFETLLGQPPASSRRPLARRRARLSRAS